MDGRLWLILIISLFFWLLSIPSHRRLGMDNKIRVPKVLARLAGSSNEYVNWRSLSFQLGYATFFLSHLLFLWLQVKNFGLYASGLTMISILAIQSTLKIIYRENQLK